MLIKRNKKGELTTTQIVTLIVLIISFIIILFLIFKLNLGSITDAEICKNSVILRGQSKLNPGPLDCKTQYVCISGGKDCEEISETEKIDVKVEDKDEIMKALADKMSECWNTFGEGKINYGDVSLIEKKVEYAICSIISFDLSVQEKNMQISYNEFYNYLETNSKSTSQSYLQYLYEINTLESFTPEEQIKVDIFQDFLLTNEKQAIITGIDNNSPKKDVILKVYIIPASELNSRLVGDKEFLTKA